jgi:hypothetical protein
MLLWNHFGSSLQTFWVFDIFGATVVDGTGGILSSSPFSSRAASLAGRSISFFLVAFPRLCHLQSL